MIAKSEKITELTEESSADSKDMPTPLILRKSES